MSRLTDLIAQTKAQDPQLGADLEREFRALSSRLAFGLNFERHRPEAVELPGRVIRKGDKVRILPERGSTEKGDQRLWVVKKLTKGTPYSANIDLLEAKEPESRTEAVADLVVVAEFRDRIYPGLISTGKVERGGDKPYHTVINGENYHALKALTYTHRGKVDAIYIDPPYNTGARDWKYNNDYVAEDDLYRHSKWLAMMERRLLLARELLNPESAVLIVTIDEKEYLRLGLLLEQVFPDAKPQSGKTQAGKIQMVSSVINPKGTGRGNEMLRVNEFVYFLWFGKAQLGNLKPEDEDDVMVPWDTMRRRNLASKRGRKGKGACGPNQFYPIYVNKHTGRIEEIGIPLPPNMPIEKAPAREGCVSVFPIRPDGTEMNWSLTDSTCKMRWNAGYVRSGKYEPDEPQKYIIQFIAGGDIAAIDAGEAEIVSKNEDGSVEARRLVSKERTPTTQWNLRSHFAEHNGTVLLKALTPGRDFPFPKSLYAVEDALRLFIESNQSAVVLDFFSGSGTTAHAVMRLNKQDGGYRQCISVTNNEVSPDEQFKLREQGLRPGDVEWESRGICEYITKARLQAAISGVSTDGDPLEGHYKFYDEFPMSEGFHENAEFFTLSYESPIAVGNHLAFGKIASLLWMRAGAQGRRIEKLPSKGWDIADTYGVLADLDKSATFKREIAKKVGARIAFIVTDDERRFQALARRLPASVEPARLYESYLTNFSFASGEQE